MRDFGTILAEAALRQYGIRFQGFLLDTGAAPAELEARAISVDLETTQKNIVDAVRPIKARAAARGGKSNLRSGYFFVESVNGFEYTGPLAGVLGTAYKNSGNSNADGDSFGLRSHVDAGTNGGFQVAEAKVGETNNPAFGYTIRTGSGRPLPTHVAGF